MPNEFPTLKDFRKLIGVAHKSKSIPNQHNQTVDDPRYRQQSCKTTISTILYSSPLILMAQNAKTFRGTGDATAARTLESITGPMERHSIGMQAVVEFGAGQAKSTRAFEEQQRKMLAQHARVGIPTLEPATKIEGNVRYAVASGEARQLVGVIGDVRAGGDTVVIDQLIAKDKARQMGGTISGHVALEFMK